MIVVESHLTQRLDFKVSMKEKKPSRAKVNSAKSSGRSHVGDHILSLIKSNSAKFFSSNRTDFLDQGQEIVGVHLGTTLYDSNVSQ